MVFNPIQNPFMSTGVFPPTFNVIWSTTKVSLIGSFNIYPVILLQPNGLRCLLWSRIAGTYYIICWWQSACAEAHVRAGLQQTPLCRETPSLPPDLPRPLFCLVRVHGCCWSEACMMRGGKAKLKKREK